MTSCECMGVTIDEISGISRAVVLEHGRGLQVAGVTLSDGAIERVEVILAITGCHDGVCRFVVNVTRTDGEAFEREFRSKLGEALARHHAAPT